MNGISHDVFYYLLAICATTTTYQAYQETFLFIIRFANGRIVRVVQCESGDAQINILGLVALHTKGTAFRFQNKDGLRERIINESEQQVKWKYIIKDFLHEFCKKNQLWHVMEHEQTFHRKQRVSVIVLVICFLVFNNLVSGLEISPNQLYLE